jgi:hypothetical protein
LTTELDCDIEEIGADDESPFVQTTSFEREERIMNSIIPFHSLVQDKVTGFKGFIVVRVEHMNDCIRYVVQPGADKKGKRPDSMVIDGPNLVIIAPPKDSLTKTNENVNTFNLGVKVRDRLTGLTGILVLRVKHRYSGDRYGIQPPMDEKGAVPEVVQLDEEDIEQIDPPLPKKKPKGKKEKPPNGPHDSRNILGR